MPVHLGISPIGWSNDDLPELDGDMPLDTCLAEARWDGYDGISSTTNFLGIRWYCGRSSNGSDWR